MLSADEYRLKTLMQAMRLRQESVKDQLQDARRMLQDAQEAASATCGRQGRVWPTGLTPEEVSEALGRPQLRWHQKERVLSLLDFVDTFLCWPASGGKTLPMHILAAMFPGCVTLVICPLLALARER